MSEETTKQEDEIDPPEDRQEVLEDAREDALDFLEGILDSIDLEGEVTVEIEDDSLVAEIKGADVGVLIGRKGQTLDAIQELLRSVVQRQAQTRVRTRLDIEGYRTRRKETLEKEAVELANRALEEGEIELEPMSAFERKIVHDAVSDIEGVTSFSEGEEPRRRVILKAT
ncbi:MAG: RNA-binding cell elongation regulator Jag/EloR [Actinomycetota bacterium]